MTVSILATRPEPHFTAMPAEVARFLANQGDWDGTPKIVLTDADDEPIHWLNPEQALALAERLVRLAGSVGRHERPIRRLASVDDRLRGIDD